MKKTKIKQLKTKKQIKNEMKLELETAKSNIESGYVKRYNAELEKLKSVSFKWLCVGSGAGLVVGLILMRLYIYVVW